MNLIHLVKELSLYLWILSIALGQNTDYRIALISLTAMVVVTVMMLVSAANQVPALHVFSIPSNKFRV